jgi:hypothetical protein
MRLSAGILLICVLIGTTACSRSSTNQPSQTNQPSPATEQSAATPAPNSSATVVTSASSEAPGSPATAKPKVDACTLLTSDEIKAVQGEPVKESKASDRVSGDFIVTQCYYELPTTSNSISLTLTEGSDKKGGENLKEYWERTFGKDEKKGDSERKRDQEKKKEQAKPESRREGEEEEESAPLEPVKGLGDEAFWSASRVGGALYVLKRDHYIRISVGGKGEADAKLRKSKTLALKALERL